ncbi:hypothetical protein [Halovenus salina]|uniref:Uncharacterized protein n=1 Tax=Halovenus salina TaxID=1510225 RepID=A0ABD5W6I3_9EURY
MLRQFLDQHGADLPTSVSEDAHQRLRSRETASTITEQRAQAAVDGLEEQALTTLPGRFSPRSPPRSKRCVPTALSMPIHSLGMWGSLPSDAASNACAMRTLSRRRLATATVMHVSRRSDTSLLRSIQM